MLSLLLLCSCVSALLSLSLFLLSSLPIALLCVSPLCVSDHRHAGRRRLSRSASRRSGRRTCCCFGSCCASRVERDHRAECRWQRWQRWRLWCCPLLFKIKSDGKFLDASIVFSFILGVAQTSDGRCTTTLLIVQCAGDLAYELGFAIHRIHTVFEIRYGRTVESDPGDQTQSLLGSDGTSKAACGEG